MATINDNGVYKTPTGQIVWNAERPTVAMGSPLAAKDAKMPSFIQAILDKNGATAKEHIVLRSLSAVQYVLEGHKTGGIEKWLDDNFKPLPEAEAEPIRKAIADGKPLPTKSEAPSPSMTAEQPTAKSVASSSTSRLQLVASSLKEFRNFFKEFEYEPDPRTLNTIAHIEGAEGKAKFILASAKVEGRDEEIVASMASKMTSAEFKAMADRQDAIAKGDAINKRLVIYFGSAGTGKTTKAMADNPTAEVIIGSASQDPDDLFSRFDPATKTYVLTALGKAMKEGKPIVIDEANLLPTACLTRIQGVTDNKSVITDDHVGDIAIADGFQVIVTMNLETNFGKTPLPSPLVSRAKEIVDFDAIADKDELIASWVYGA